MQRIKTIEFQEVLWQHSNTGSYHHKKIEKKQFGFFSPPYLVGSFYSEICCYTNAYFSTSIFQIKNDVSQHM